MKKFLTVLLVIAVMFTFSFSSAFATVDQGGVKEDKAQFAIPTDFYLPGTINAPGKNGTLGVTTETKEDLLDCFDNVASGFDPTQDYTAYYGAGKNTVEASTTSYVGKVMDELGELREAANSIADLYNYHSNKFDFGKLFEYVSGSAKAFVRDSGLQTILNEYADVPDVDENNEFMSNAEAAELDAVWAAALAEAEKATTAADIAEIYEDATDAEGKITAKYEAYEKQIVKYAKLNVNAKLTDGIYLLPNYGRFIFSGLVKDYSLALQGLTPNEQHSVIAWLLDNGYTTKASFEEGTAKLVEALVPYSTWSKEYADELKAIAKEITNVNQSLLIAKSTETKLADVAALYDKVDAFQAKYAITQADLTKITDTGIDIELTGIANLLREEIAASVLTNADAIKALNMVHNTMTDAETAEAIKLAQELYANFDALYEDNETVMQKIYPVKIALVTTEEGKDSYETGNYVDITKYSDELNLETVLLYAKDTYALKLLTTVAPLVKFDFTAYKFENLDKDNKFVGTTANLKAIAEARAAVEEYYATYGDLVALYTDNNTYSETGYTSDSEWYAAKLLAAEYNAVAAGLVDPKPTAKEIAAAQTVLDNAVVKVTTQALGNGKIRVQAKLDDDTWAFVKGATGNDIALAKAPKYTVTYKFYKKKAADKKYKGYSDKAVNYTVFKNLKKGTKYNFRCAVTLTDANGNVVATRAFTGSTKGTRTAK